MTSSPAWKPWWADSALLWTHWRLRPPSRYHTRPVRQTSPCSRTRLFRRAYREIALQVEEIRELYDFIWMAGVVARVEAANFADLKAWVQRAVGFTVAADPLPGHDTLWPLVFTNRMEDPFVRSLLTADARLTPGGADALLAALASTAPVATPPFAVDFHGDAPLQLVVQRISYCNASSTPVLLPCSSREAPVIGLAVAVVDLLALLRHVVSPEPYEHTVGLQIETGGSIATWGWPSSGEEVLTTRQFQVAAFGGQVWTVRVASRDEGVSDSASLASWLLLGAGVLFAVVVAVLWRRQIVTASAHARQKAENAQRQARCEAESRREALVMFMRTTSHDMRTPLHAVLMALEEAAAAREDDERQEALSMAHGSASMLDLIVSNVLDVGRIERGELRLEVGPVDLHPVFTSLAGMVRARCVGSGVDVVHRGRPPTLVCDASRVARCALNALSNSRKFTSTGRIVLETVAVDDPEVALRMPKDLLLLGQFHSRTWRHPEFDSSAPRRDGETLLCVTVADTGRGMTAEEVEACVRPFVHSASDNAHGTGLGLHVVLASVLAHRGFLTIASAVGRGTLVRMCFPAQLATETTWSASADSAATAASAPGGLTARIGSTSSVLIVDDEAVNAKLMQRLIQRMLGSGVAVLRSSNGEEALRMVQEAPARVGLVFMDANMPVMGGLEATRRIRGIVGDGFAQPRIVMLTGNATEEDRRAAMDAGADAFETKPCSKRALLSHLRRAGLQVAGLGQSSRASAGRSDHATSPRAVPSFPLALAGPVSRAGLLDPLALPRSTRGPLAKPSPV
mmetsp:Transcript_29825/g.97606  ORF Transcript_29825/g.97606 Transcript_29825/m.97606 type:complete len:799 (-) Transcript_29825:55-2451(-)